MSKVNDDAANLDLTLQDIKEMIKSAAKGEIKKRINTKIKEEVIGNATTKMRTVCRGEFGEKKYLRGNFSGEDVSDVLKTKLHMLPMKNNFKGVNNEDEKCGWCSKDIETTEHIFTQCSAMERIRRDIPLQEETLGSEEDADIRQILKFKKMWDKIQPHKGNN